MERRVFVLTSAGERGPFTVDDLKRELQAGAVQRSDQLRTAFGKTVGTVGDMVGPHVPGRLSGRMAAVTGGDGGALMPRQYSKSQRQTSATNLRPIVNSTPSARSQAKPETWWRVPLAIMAGLLLLGAVFYAGKATSAPTAPPASSASPALPPEPTGPPTIRVDVIQHIATPGKHGLIRISSDHPLAATLTLRGTVSGFKAPSLVMAAGTSTLDIPVLVSDRKLGTKEKVATEGIVNLQPGDGYRLGTGVRATVRLRDSPEPLVAFDDFNGHAPGWREKWTDTPLEAAPGFGVKAIAGTSFRALSERITSGDVWLSFMFRSDENLTKVAGFSLFEDQKEQIFIGRALERGGMSIVYAPETSRFLVQPDHQFTQPTRMVANLRITSNETVVKWWLLSAAPVDPPSPLGSMLIPFMAFESVRVYAEQPWYLGDLRIGKSWDEVVPLP